MVGTIQDLTSSESKLRIEQILNAILEQPSDNGTIDWRNACEAVARQFGVSFDQVQYAIVAGESNGRLVPEDYGSRLRLAS